MARKGESAKLKSVIKKIADHGAEVVELIEVDWAEGRNIKNERVLIILEMLYQKAINGDGSMGAAVHYMDRILGKPKESLLLDNGDDTLQRLSDDQLVSRIAGIIKTVRAADAGDTS